jgi:glycosyltransferase involved in cell wall biosynthesis
MISIVIPAYNEEAVIGRCLKSLTGDGSAEPGELEIVVACNGCHDKTARIAREFGAPVRVLETDISSKSAALNLADRAATSFPRIYVDADIILSLDSVRRLAGVLDDKGVLAAAPAVGPGFPEGTGWVVRAYYQFWMALPYIQEGMMAAGVYAVSREGRKRFAEFPAIIADDGYVRLHFTSEERVEVAAARSIVSAPAKLRDLILIKTRSRLGIYQLQARFPELYAREAKSKGYGRAFRAILKQPTLWPCAIPYVCVNLLSRYRAQKQLRVNRYVWERDNSSRGPSAANAAVAAAASPGAEPPTD